MRPERLREVHTMDDVFAFLTDELDWPLDADDLDDATYEYSAEDLGIAPERVPHLVSLRQLRPVTVDQPWGIFFIEFSGPRLPVTPLRRLLQALVAKKRAMGDGGQKTWQLDDLLFIITTDSGDSVELHFLAFFDAGEPTLEIRSLPWRPGQSPNQHLKRLATELLPNLAWPDQPGDVEDWRTHWREAFKLRHGEAIRTAAQLAERMAQTATDLRAQIEEALGKERGDGPFSRLLGEVHCQLVADVDAARFADMCAQTLVYGVLSSRVTDPIGFGASPTLSVVPLSNPFLAAFFEQVHDEAVDLDLEGSGLEQLIADLREPATNIESILDQFGSTAKGGDPVVHFYEEFLKQYDRKMRADAGAFYTPQPVVEFMVRTVDELLRSKFGLEMGIADPSSWGDVAERVGFDVPAGVSPASPFISMLDPATGTGTFLVEWLRRARQSFREVEPNGDWPGHLRAHVLPAMHAFELMLGPYAIAHLKVALELHDEGIEDGEATILLTDTLDHSPAELRLETMRDPVAIEGEIAAELKSSERFTVIVGNPPYDREQRDSSGGTGKRKGGVIRYGVPGVKPLLDDVIEPMKSAGLGVHVKNLYNDYVYFWRWAVWQATQTPEGPGVVAFITASSYLDGVSMGGLRSFLRRSFDELWIVDLGGEGRGARTEENVFDILTPVTIAFGVRTGDRRSGDSCRVQYLAISGTRDEKFDQLAKLAMANAAAAEVDGTGLAVLTPRSDNAYFNWPQITDLFPIVFPGVKAGRTWVIGPTKSLLKARMRSLIGAIPAKRRELFKDSPTGRKSADRLGRTSMPGEWESTPVRLLKDEPGLSKYGYRSFDRQYVIADPRFLDRASASWSVDGPKQVFLTTLTTTKLGNGPALTVSPYVPDLDFFRGSYGAKNAMPLYRDRRGTEANLPAGLLPRLTGELGAEVTPEAFLGYVHGLLGTSAYGQRFADELGEGAGPARVPLTSDGALFERVSAFGRELLWWHTWGERFAPNGSTGLPEGSARSIDPIVGYPEKYSFDPSSMKLTVGTGSFGPVSPEVWAFEVSGLKALQSWLGNRMAAGKGKKSSPLDDIRPTRWTFTDELLQLLAILEHTVEVTPLAAELLAEVLAGPLISADELPTPTDAERKAPKA